VSNETISLDADALSGAGGECPLVPAEAIDFFLPSAENDWVHSCRSATGALPNMLLYSRLNCDGLL